MPATYVLGIDLGTTNSVLAYAPLSAEKPAGLKKAPEMAAPGTAHESAHTRK